MPGRGANQEKFTLFVEQSADGLSRLGYLLSGDHERTERLVRSTVVRVYREWPRGSPEEILVREWLDDPGEDYVGGLGALPPRQRAAVVLRYWSRLPAAEVARILDCAEAEVAELDEWPEYALRAVAADARPVAVSADEAAEAALAQRRQRWRSVAVAAVVLVVAGVFATMISVGAPESAPEAEVVAPPSWTGVPTGQLAPDMGAVVVDDQARKLTAQLAGAMDRVLPEVTNVRSGPSGPRTGYTERPPLEFYTRVRSQPPGTYFAQAIVDAHGESAFLLLEVRREPEPEAPEQASCREFERDCRSRAFPDRTRADVVGYLDPASQNIVRTLNSLRPDGTSVQVTVFGVERESGAPSIGVAELFRFAQVFTF